MSDSDQLSWGIYATHTRKSEAVDEWSVYYLGLTRQQALFDQGRGRDVRHTSGIAVRLRTGAMAHALEGTFQWGTFHPASSSQAPIRAWKYSHGTSVVWRETPLRPSAGLNFAISSGDKRADDPALQTFHPLFPKGLYYGHIDSSGSLNAIVLHPQLTVRPASTITVKADTFLFWRQRLGDGLYSQPGFLLRSGIGVPGRSVGWLQDVEVSLQADRHTTVHLLATYYRVGTFLRASQPPGKDDLYIGVKASYRF